MNNERDISHILEDLYAIDPSFREHEPELRALIARVMELKPETHFDESFAAKLRSELAAMHPKKFHVSQAIVSPFQFISTMNIYSGLAGALLAILIITPLTYVATERYALPPGDSSTSEEQANLLRNITTNLPSKPQISDKGKNAFGAITMPAGGSDAPLASSAATMTKMSVPSAADRGKTSYTYKGNDFRLNDTAGSVLKRVRGIGLSESIRTVLQGANIGLLNLSTFNFKSAALHTLDLTEDAGGYSISINFDEGLISIVSNTASNGTGTQSIDAATLISTASEFLNKHNIDRSIYTQPVISPQSSSTVVFPLVLNGKEVYDEFGNAFGLEVVVDPSQRKVVSVNNLTYQQYDSSSYPLETDFKKVVASVAPASSSTDATVLGTPKRVLMRYIAETGEELFVPALLFPTETKSAKSTPKNVIVPLAKVGVNPSN